ncbi:MAG: hypothetical protein KFH98_10190 [Gemmatimonadetes bacterium]|nr:hypothetical protein [Gemmatimonadota bacterium]
MRGLIMVRPGTVALAAVLTLPGALAAQSLTSTRGPGYPVIATDARSMVLGGLGIGLQGFAAPLVNPASVSHTRRRGAVVALEAVDRNVRLGDAEDDVGTTRFPLIRVVFPVRGAVLTAGYGGYLDQSWGLMREGEQLVGDETVGFVDQMRSEGGVGQFQAGAAVPIGPRVGVGASVGLNMGSQRVRYTRFFDTALDSYTEALSWRYSGPTAQLGVRWAPMDIVHLGASVTWAGTLEGEPTDGRAEARELDLPLQLAAGASGFLVPGLLAAVSGRWSGWSGTDASAVGLPGAPDGAASRDTWEVGGGLEWAPARPTARRTFPLRVGFQYRQLPFPFVDDAPTEWFAGAGAGIRVGADPVNPFALVDVGVQRGARTASGGGALGDLTERLWRIAISISLFGN